MTAVLSKILLYGLLIVLLPLFFASAYVNVYLPFINATKSIRLEIRRSEGDEREFWKRELRILYVRAIPLVGEPLYRWFCNKD